MRGDGARAAALAAATAAQHARDCRRWGGARAAGPAVRLSSRFLSQSSDPGLPSVPAAVSALAHYTGGLRGTGRRKHRRSERAKTPESSAMQQFRVQSSTSGLGGGTRLSWGSGASSNLKNAAWHHRLAQGRRSVELWREDTEPALVQRSASRAGQQGPERRGLVPLPAAERATGNWAALAGADAESVADSDRASDWEVRTHPSRGSAAGCASTDRAMFGSALRASAATGSDASASARARAPTASARAGRRRWARRAQCCSARGSATSTTPHESWAGRRAVAGRRGGTKCCRS